MDKSFYLPANVLGGLIVQTDLDLNIINLNQETESAYGWKKKTALGKNYLALCKKAKHKLPFPSNLSKPFNKKIASKFETDIVQPDGQIKTFSWLFNVLVSEKGKAESYVFLGTDITDYKKLLRQEESLQAYLKHILDNIPCYIYWKDLNCVYIGCNQKFAQAAGYHSPNDIIGKSDFNLAWGKTEAQLFRQSDQEVLQGIAKLNFEEPQLQADGKYATVLASKVPMRDKRGNIIGILGIYFDITDRKKAEEELKLAKERAEVANKTKSDFLAVVSHELRIPLTGILGMAQLLNEDKLLTEQQEHVTDIIKSGEYLLSVVTDILDYAKLEAGKTEIFLAPLDFRKLIEETATMLSSKVKEKGLELLINYAHDAPHLIISDARTLRHVLLNLTGNAVKFTSKGYIWINVECSKKNKQQATLVLSVRDSGIGISKDKHATIFDRFSQADASTTRRYGGTGLGLAITKAYVEELGGKISVRSEPNKGAVFSCTLPFQLQNSSKLASPWEQYKSKVRILVVDDTLHGEVLCRHIASSLCELTCGKDALNTLRGAQQHSEPFDIVIINQQLVDIDYIELAKQIQTQFRQHQPMLVLVAKQKSLPQMNVALKAGFFECFRRPTHPTELLVCLTAAWEKWVDNRTLLPTPIKTKKQKAPKILLVEDDAIIQKIHTAMLKKLGCEVDLAENGYQALQMATHNYDLIFMDVGLPDLDGIEVAKQITHQINVEHAIHTPIIGLTGYGDDENKNKCLAVGMDDVAVKPVKFEEIQRLLLLHTN